MPTAVLRAPPRIFRPCDGPDKYYDIQSLVWESYCFTINGYNADYDLHIFVYYDKIVVKEAFFPLLQHVLHQPIFQ